jgi:uncharacterized damage-inducible protein DinB
MEAPKYPLSIGSERELLDSHLEFCRQTLIYKVTGITKSDGVKRLGPTSTSILGVLKHVTEVEYWWFQNRFLGETVSSESSIENPDGEFVVQEVETVASLLLAYESACENSRRIVKERSLDDQASFARPRDGIAPSLRWIYLHLIDEIARHNGQIDIYRELLDGAHDGLPAT